MKNIGLQMYEFKIIQLKIDCNFRKKQDGGHFINGYHITFHFDSHFGWHVGCSLFYPKPLNRIILENRLHKFKLHSSSSKSKHNIML